MIILLNFLGKANLNNNKANKPLDKYNLCNNQMLQDNNSMANLCNNNKLQDNCNKYKANNSQNYNNNQWLFKTVQNKTNKEINKF